MPGSDEQENLVASQHLRHRQERRKGLVTVRAASGIHITTIYPEVAILDGLIEQ